MSIKVKNVSNCNKKYIYDTNSYEFHKIFRIYQFQKKFFLKNLYSVWVKNKS